MQRGSCRSLLQGGSCQAGKGAGGATAPTVRCAIVAAAYTYGAKLRDEAPTVQFHVFVHVFMPKTPTQVLASSMTVP